MSWAWDVDGTLVLPSDDNPISLPVYRVNWPALKACQQIARAREACPFYITARSELLRTATRDQLEAIQAPPGRLFCQPDELEWSSAAMISYKTSILNATTPQAFVGDTDEDEAAAAQADVPFYHVDEICQMPGPEFKETALQ